MKICVSVLPLIIGVILQFGVLTSETPPGSPKSPPKVPLKAPEPKFSVLTGKLYEIRWGDYAYPISHMKLKELNTLDMGCLLYRRGVFRGFIGRLTDKGFINYRAPKWAGYINKQIKNEYFRPKPEDVVFNPAGTVAIGVYRYNNEPKPKRKLTLYKFEYNTNAHRHLN